MKQYTILIFIALVTVIYFIGNYYIFIRGWQVIPKFKSVRLIYTIIFISLSLSFILFQIFERATEWISLNQVLSWIGAYWLAIMLYAFLILIFIDLFRLLALITDYPDIIKNNLPKVRQILGIVVSLTILLLITLGSINANRTIITKLELKSDKELKSHKSLKIAMVSDVHMGHIISNKKITRMVKMINELKPDIVLIAGDLMDQEIKPVIKNKLGEKLLNINAKYGLYLIPGNHEFIGGIKDTEEYIRKLGIPFLRDTSVLIDNSFYIIGRNDKEMKAFNGKKRKSLNNLLTNIDLKKPAILLDHQPYKLEKVANYNIDLQLSGHTHKGQMFPFNLATNAIFEKHYGYIKKNNTHFYISSGFGTWGPPVRIGSKSEIVFIELQFK